MRVGYYQFRPLFGKIRRNLDKIVKTLGDVSADLIVLPELAFTGYYFRDREEVKTLAEDPGHSSTIDSLAALCRHRNFHLIAGFAEKHRDKYFNSAVLIGPNGIEHIYRKLHLFNEEKNWFDDGDIYLQINPIQDAKIGIMVCFDWAFPEVTRVLALQGADIICHPSNLVLAYCQQAMLTRCLENKVYAITTNRFGVDKRPHGSLKFTGRSQIVAPGGTLIHRAQSQREELYIMEIDPALARDKSITALNEVLADRRPEYYSNLN
ncbi:MAG: hydrolase protein [Gammaproteobacteria bacterium]|nr:hydrolase protein [Gammaproteobacteria bacterium]